MAVTHELDLSMVTDPGALVPEVVLRQGDAQTQKIQASIFGPDGAAYTSSYTSVRLEVVKPDGTLLQQTATKSGSTVSVTLNKQAVAAHGLCRQAHFSFYSGTTYIESTEDFSLRILPGGTDVPLSEDYIDDLEEALASANSAASAANTAATRANNAATSASSAATSATNAATSATDAAGDATDAAREATDAAAAANTATGNANTATSAANTAADSANSAAADAISAAAEARGAVSANMTLYLGHETVNGVQMLTLFDLEG